MRKPVSEVTCKMGFFEHRRGAGGPFQFRVSDIVDVPLRGHLLRLRLVQGRPSIEDMRPGRRLRLRAPDGAERIVPIEDLSITGGRQTQERLERTKELDVIISDADARKDGRPVAIGWLALGPVRDEESSTRA